MNLTTKVIAESDEKHDIRLCRNCGETIHQELFANIWTHGEWNRFYCTNPFPLPKKFDTDLRYECKLHDYQPSDVSDAMVCQKCFRNIAKSEFFTNRNVFWCRIHNMKFTNINYHKKKHHANGVVMDYIEYVSNPYKTTFLM